MPKKRFSAEQIVTLLRQIEALMGHSPFQEIAINIETKRNVILKSRMLQYRCLSACAADANDA